MTAPEPPPGSTGEEPPNTIRRVPDRKVRIVGGRSAEDGPCVQVRVPAKLNLFLSVRGRRPDGYHELVTVMQSVSLYDRLRVVVVGPPGQGHHPAGRRRMRVQLVAADAGMPPVEDNLAVRAARALGPWAGLTDLGVVGDGMQLGIDATPRTRMVLSKGIPVAGGMAGGSADAAAALVALNELWQCQLTREELRGVGAQLGSDVPFCVVGGTALATGRGAALAQVLCRGTFHWVVCRSDEPLGTPQVYAAWDRNCRPNELEPDAVLAALRGQDAEALGAALHNDLQPAAFVLRPELSELRESLLDAGALGAVLSGSGPTLLALAADEDAAKALADRVRGDFAAVDVASSPVGGPDLQPCPPASVQ